MDKMNTAMLCAEADFGQAAGHFNRNLHCSNTAPNLVAFQRKTNG